MKEETEKGTKWWIRYVFVPLGVALIGGGGLCAVAVAVIPYIFATSTPTQVVQVIVTFVPDIRQTDTPAALMQVENSILTPLPISTFTPTPTFTITPTFTSTSTSYVPCSHFQVAAPTRTMVPVPVGMWEVTRRCSPAQSACFYTMEQSSGGEYLSYEHNGDADRYWVNAFCTEAEAKSFGNIDSKAMLTWWHNTKQNPFP